MVCCMLISDHLGIHWSANISDNELLLIYLGHDSNHQRRRKQRVYFKSPFDGLLYPGVFLYDYGYFIYSFRRGDGRFLLAIFGLHAHDLESTDRNRLALDDDRVHISHQA